MGRIALKNSTIVNGDQTYIIDSVAGDGANCIVYFAHYLDNAGYKHDVLLKECYPAASNISRTGNDLIWADTAEKNRDFAAFQDAYKKLMQAQNSEKARNSTAIAFQIFNANGTIYAVVHKDIGITYDKETGKSLLENLETALALTKAVKNYHDNGYLHLDIKPSNFLVIPETRQLVKLFDLDTVMLKAEIATAQCIPYSEDWAAPEQIQGQRNKICEATDLYAIGAILFEKVMGRKVEQQDCGVFAQWEFDERIYEEVNPRVVRILRNILRKTISTSVRRRYQTAQELIAALEDAVKVAREDVFVVSNCPPSMAQFIGREDELAKIHDHFSAGCRAVFLYGFGGMGKTELSKKYAACFGQEYDACLFQMYQPEYGLKKYIESIQIHNADGKDAEKQLRGLLNKSRVLLIVDNFDVDDDEHLEDLLSLNADILFTTRNDFSDQASDTIQILNLDALPMGQLLVLFQRELRRPMSLDDLQAAQKIIESVDNWTMIVPIIAKQIVASGKSVMDYAQMMEEDGFRALNEDTEEIRIRYHGKLHHKTPMGILRYVFDVGALSQAELEALCNVSVLRYHKALTKERYRYYTGAKNLNALNRIINAGWVKYDGAAETISLHPMVVELIESDLERTPDTVPGLFKYISKQFAMLDNISSIQDAKTITFALLMLTDLELEETVENEIYLHLANFVAKFFPTNITATYKLLFDAPEESTWSINTSYLPEKLVVPNMEKYASENMADFLDDLLLKLVARYSFMLYGGETPLRPVELTPSNKEEVTNADEAEAYVEVAKRFVDTYAVICPSPNFNTLGEVQSVTDWRLNLKEHPAEYPYYRFLLESICVMIKISAEYGIDLDDKYRVLANNLIVLIQDSLGLFEWHQLSAQQIIDYKIMADEEYQKNLSAYKSAHYSKRASAWYQSLEKSLAYVSDPYPIFKYILSVDFELPKSRVALLLKKDFATKLLFDPRLTGEQKRYLSVEFCAEQVDELRYKHCKKPTRVKGLAKSHKNLLTLYAQLLSGAELLLKDVYTWAEEPVRIDIFRAAFILKRTIGIEILDPKPHILFDISPHYHLAYFLSDFFELAEWTRTSGYVKQSQQMKTAILDSCLLLDYDSMKEIDIQNILFRVEPLARKYKRQDVIDLLSKYHNVRRSFFVDLLDTHKLTQSQKVQAIGDLTNELLWQLCDYHYDKTVMSAEEFAELGCYHTCECQQYTEVFISAYSKIRSVFAQGSHVGVDLCAAMVVPDLSSEKESMRFLENAQWKLERLIRSDEYAIYNEHEEIDGLVYLIFEHANLKLLASEAKDIIMDLSEMAAYSKEHIAEIISNIHRIRPETKEFLTIE